MDHGFLLARTNLTILTIKQSDKKIGQEEVRLVSVEIGRGRVIYHHITSVY